MALFTTKNYPVSALVEDIALGKIGLPELQRPFVWPNVNVRKLFDSLYRGYPAGFLLLWDTGGEGGLKGIGVDNTRAKPKLAIVDGQQRLTSLYAVIKGVEVLRADFRKERIRIAFNPLSEQFEVTDAAIVKDRAFIPDISALWAPGAYVFDIINEFTEALSRSRELTLVERRNIGAAISRLHNLPQYHFVALELISSINVSTIAEVFVRINGEGKRLNESDFIMTLLSVYWEEGRTEFEAFSRAATQPSGGAASPYNAFIKPAPDQMLRVTAGLALKRARLETVYNALRGRDVKTGLEDPERRNAQFAMMREGQKAALDLGSWHYFLSALTLAGYRGEKMISSKTTLIYCYVLYLIGVRDYGLKRTEVRQQIAEFYYMAALTGRYTSSSETAMDADLSVLSNAKDGAAFLAKLREIAGATLTPDYWSITLPNALAKAAARSPALFGYQAALIKLDACALYGSARIAALVDPLVNGPKAGVEQHHLFPRAYLESIGVTELRDINQIANFAAVEWPDNIAIGKKPPSQYAPPLDAALSAARRERDYFHHALGPLWWEMPYRDFLADRRGRMAQVVRAAWVELSGGAPTPAPTVDVPALIAAGEGGSVEFKATMRTNLHTGQVDSRMELAVLKSLAGFLNAQGGRLLVGVADDGQVLGLKADGFVNEDKMALHLVNLVRDRIGELFLPYVHPAFQDQDGERVLVVRCERGPRPAFVKEGGVQRFFVRGGNATAELSGASVTDYVRQRFD